jgi:Flp pilus assembly protein TadD
MNKPALGPLASALLATTAAPLAAHAQGAAQAPAAGQPQVLLPGYVPQSEIATPTNQTPVVQGAAPKAVAASGTQALIAQADTQRQRGRKDLSTAALQRALSNSPNNPDVLQRFAQYTIQDGDYAAANTWLQRLRSATSPKDSRVVALERQLSAANAPQVSESLATAPVPNAAPTPAAAPKPPRRAPPPIATVAPRRAAPVVAPTPVRTAPRKHKAPQTLAVADAEPPPHPIPYAAPQPAPAAAPQPAPAPAEPRPAPPSPDPGAQARTSGFLALNGGDLATAERDFNQALRLRTGDLDAAGGLGVIRLQQQRFSEARELLLRAIKGPDGNERWGQALQTAEFFAGLERARTAYNAGRYGEAEQEARRLVETSSTNRIEALILLGQAEARQNRPAEAETAFRQAIAITATRVDAISGLAQALADLGRFDEASRVIAQVPNGQAAAVRSNIERARAADLQRKGDMFGAAAALASAVQTTPSDPWTRFDFARLLLAQGQVAQSQAVAAPLYTASDPESLQAAALYSDQRGRSAEAALLLRRIPESARNAAVRELAGRFEGEAVLAQAKQWGLAGQKTQAVGLVRNYLSRSSPPFEMRGRIAQTLLDLGDIYQAGAMALEAARSPPATFSPSDASGFLAVLAQTGQDGAAMSLLAAAARQAQGSPANQQAYRSLTASFSAQRADRLRAAGDYAGAFDILSQAFALSPRDPGLIGALARLYQTGNMPQQAQQAFDSLLSMSPNDIDAIRGAAQAAQASGDYPRAERLLHRAVSLRPNDPELYFQIGQLEQSRGHDRDALRAFQRADALLKSGRGLNLAGGARPGGVLGPNPFLRSTPAPAPSAYGGPAAAYPAPSYGGASAYGAGFVPMSLQEPAGSDAPRGGGPMVYSAQAEPPIYAQPGSGGPMTYSAQAEPPTYAPTMPANSAPYGVQPTFAQPGADSSAYPPQGYAQGQPSGPFTLPGLGDPAYPAPAPSLPYGTPGPGYQAQAGIYDNAATAAPLPSYPGPAPGLDPAATGFAPPPAPAGSASAPDQPLPLRINQQIDALRESTSPRIEGEADLRTRSGQQGTSALFETTTHAEASFSPWGTGQLGVAVAPLFISGGVPNAAAAALIGTTPLALARATAAGKTLTLNTANTLHDTGAALSVFYRSDNINADVGSTPLGFEQTNLSGGISGHIPLGGGSQLRGSIEQRPVTDSVLSYGGQIDPQTGVKSGSVIRDSGSFGGSVTFGAGGAYADGTYKSVRGNNVAANTGYEVNAGVYYRPIDSDGNRLQVGVNVNMQSYQKNLRFFSFGQGGYFSPQQFISMGLPISYTVDRTKWHWSLGFTVGMQSYTEDSSPIFPTLPYAQASMVDYAAGFPTISAVYPGDTHTGVAIAALASGEYKILPTTVTGAELSVDTFGIYSEYKFRFYLRRTLTGAD